MLRKLILHLHFTKSHKRDSIYELCLLHYGKTFLVNVTPWHVSKLIYCTHAQEYNSIEIPVIPDWIF